MSKIFIKDSVKYIKISCFVLITCMLSGCNINDKISVDPSTENTIDSTKFHNIQIASQNIKNQISNWPVFSKPKDRANFYDTKIWWFIYDQNDTLIYNISTQESRWDSGESNIKIVLSLRSILWSYLDLDATLFYQNNNNQSGLYISIDDISSYQIASSRILKKQIFVLNMLEKLKNKWRIRLDNIDIQSLSILLYPEKIRKQLVPFVTFDTTQSDKILLDTDIIQYDLTWTNNYITKLDSFDGTYTQIDKQSKGIKINNININSIPYMGYASPQHIVIKNNDKNIWDINYEHTKTNNDLDNSVKTTNIKSNRWNSLTQFHISTTDNKESTQWSFFYIVDIWERRNMSIIGASHTDKLQVSSQKFKPPFDARSLLDVIEDLSIKSRQ